MSIVYFDLKKMCTRYFIEKDTPEFNDVIDKILKSPFYMKLSVNTEMVCIIVVR